MSGDPEIERLLDRWLAEGLDEVPDRAIDRALGIVERTPQRRRALGWRPHVALRAPARLALAAAAVLILVGAGAALVAFRGTTTLVGGTVAPPPNGHDDTVALQTALDACVPGGEGCTVRLSAGTYLTKQLAANGFHGTIVGAGEDRTTIQALPGYVVGKDVWTGPASASNPYPYVLTFGGASDVTVSDLSLRVTESNPVPKGRPNEVPKGWYNTYMAYPWGNLGATTTGPHVTWLDGVVRVEGAAWFSRVSFEGASGPDGGLNTPGVPGVNVDSAVVVDQATAPAGVFEMTACRTRNVGSAFTLAHFRGRATIGGSPAAGNTFTNSGGGQFFDLDGATVLESYDQIHADATSAGYFGAFFWKDHAANAPSTVLLAHNRIVAAGILFGGIDVEYAAPRDTMLHLTVTANEIVVAGAGTPRSTGLGNWAIHAAYTSGIVISNNTISGMGYEAISLANSADSTISGNILSGFTPTGSRARIALDAWTTGARVTCAGPSDTVVNDGTGNTVTGCLVSK